MIAYRPARPEDAAVLAAMARTAFTETFGHLYPPHDLATFLEQAYGPTGLPAQIDDPRYAIRLAIDGDAIAGYVKIGPNALTDHAPPDAIELYQLYVLAPWQGAGIAAALIEWAIAEARARGAPSLILSVYVDNPRAQRFYARYGLREVGRCTFPVGDTIDDERVWRLDL